MCLTKTSNFQSTNTTALGWSVFMFVEEWMSSWFMAKKNRKPLIRGDCVVFKTFLKDLTRNLHAALRCWEWTGGSLPKYSPYGDSRQYILKLELQEKCLETNCSLVVTQPEEVDLRSGQFIKNLNLAMVVTCGTFQQVLRSVPSEKMTDVSHSCSACRQVWINTKQKVSGFTCWKWMMCIHLCVRKKIGKLK